MAAMKVPVIADCARPLCPGCGHGIVSRLLAEVLEEQGLDNRYVLSLGVGCCCMLNDVWMGDLLQCAHGRSSACARGLKSGLPDCCVVAYQGDGDAYNIGLAETLNSAYGKYNITVIVINNSNFAMTGGQMSWTTLPNQKTTSSPMGRSAENTGNPIHVPEMIAAELDPAFVARGSVHNVKEINKTKKYIRRAVQAQMNNEGFSMVEVLSQCPTNWGLPPVAACEFVEKEVMQHYALGVLKDRNTEVQA